MGWFEKIKMTTTTTEKPSAQFPFSWDMNGNRKNDKNK